MSSQKIRFQDCWQPICPNGVFASFFDHLKYFASFAYWPSCDDLNDYVQMHCTTSLKNFCFSRQNPSKRAHRNFLKKIDQNSVLYYVSQIVGHSHIPTRPENWHDFLNALIWMNYPESKFALYKLYEEIAASKWKKNQQRPKETDPITCFDEGGLIGICSETDKDYIFQILCSSDQEEKKQLLSDEKLLTEIFGHGLLENYLAAHIDIHAIILLVTVADLKIFSSFSFQKKRAYIDSQLSLQIKNNQIFTAQKKASFPFKFTTLAF